MQHLLGSERSEGFLELAGVRLEWRHVGPPPDRAPTLVLLHEGLGCVGLWREVPERLAAATGCGVFAWSRQGYGRSDPISLPRSADYLALEAEQWLPQLLACMRFGRRLLVGHSDGATIAALYAARVRDPLLCGLVLIAPHFFVEDVTLAGIRRAQQAYYAGDLRQRLARWHGANVEGAFRGWSEIWLSPEFRHFDMRHELAAIGVPILLIQSEHDPYATVAQLKAVEERARVPVETLLLPGHSHAPHIDQAEPTLAVIAAFARRLLANHPGAGGPDTQASSSCGGD